MTVLLPRFYLYSSLHCWRDWSLTFVSRKNIL